MPDPNAAVRDFIYLDARGGPWIRTLQSLDTSRPIWDDPGFWHRATDPEALTSLLSRLGVAGAPPAALDTGPAPSAAADQAPARAGTGTPSQVADDGPASTDAAAWGLGGLLTGVLLTLATLALRARRASRAAEVPDEELRAATEPAEADEWPETVPEELVSTTRR